MARLEAAAGPHASVARADPYAFQVAHRRLAWLLRISAGSNVVLAASLILALSTINALMPLKETRLALVRADPADDRIYRIEPLSRTVQGVDLLLEAKARRYVKLLLEIDSVTQGERFQEAWRMTDNGFYERFKRQRIDSKAIQSAIAGGMTRTVQVESVNRLETGAPDVYKLAVDFLQKDAYGARTVAERRLRAYLSMTFRPQENVPERDKYENPLGITVLDLVLKERPGP